MYYLFSKKLKKIILIFMLTGIFLLFIALTKGYFFNIHNREENQPWLSLYIGFFYFTTISLGSLFFLCIQNISKSGWSIVIHPVMEVISSFLPYGGLMILIILLLNAMGMIHLFHWMDFYNNPTSLKYDKIIANKKLFLNIPFFLIRSIIYVTGWSFFYFRIKKISHILNVTRSLMFYKKLNRISVLFIIFFSITSIIMGWDWIMSLNPHWFSTLFSWYILSTYIVTGIGILTIISLYLKKKGCFSFFNENHLHDLSKYLFSTSLLWTYFWFSQFLLYWYGNIPEEISYFIKRKEIYHSIHLWILIPNFLVPFFGLMSSKNKKNPKVVFAVTCILLIGHYIDIYNLIVPDVKKLFDSKFGLYEIGSLLLTGSLFSYILFLNLNKKELNFIGNPFFKESENYKYPYM
ncbi:hypothetical protein [Blattabacterium cuenoti]|uniref:hypothetical protein n=1 Tax=Blattabacterium cuenoti TaxID=1653831 RepID=UPI00163B74E5|nr:hypothetical protein [Blattabacterium cuenoti]